MAVSAERISVYSLADLKNTTDDALPVYLNSLKFTQSHTLTDVRLALGYSAFLLCAATFYWDYTYGFDSTKLYTTIAVAIYTLLNTVLTFWIWGVEKTTVYVGTLPSTGEKITVQSRTEKHKPVYRLTVTTTGRDGQRVRKMVDKAFSNWFDVRGHFCAKPFQQILASGVEVLGRVDPKNVVREERVFEKEQEVDGRTMDDKWASLLAESAGGEVAAETSATPGKSAKRRNKKA
ncbi:putative signal peptidase complex subunit SPC2 [Amylocarpus encephaloides]|uniref:Signal peptidase complex subunit 2 n=1 Tax=Amylocarpus encephaloides TaxID=45428 RepID=A0A9P8C5T6_9HELO|nr:putative signal peptidase complex subunit SPC2 [Amylocarpus encephaloides]